MSKWLSNIITALVILTLTSVLGGFLKGPIDELSNQDKLKAQVQLAPWIEKPTPSRVEKSAVSNSREENHLDNVINNLKKLRYSTSDFGVAKIDIENSSGKKITDINIRLDEPYGPQESIVIDQNQHVLPLGDTDRIKIPDMSPGDRVTVFMWGGYSSYLFPERFKTYSSEGEFRVSFDWPKSKDEQYQSSISIFLDNYAGTIAIVSMLLLAISSLIGLNTYSEYVKHILEKREFYNAEKKSFAKDPKKFSPDFTKGKFTVKTDRVNEVES